MYGKHHTKEAREKISKGLKGRKRSKEHCKNISRANKGHVAWNKGKRLSEEEKRRIYTPELLKRMSESRSGEKNGFYGKHHSDDTIKRIVEANKGRKHTKETRRKQSESHKGEKCYWYGKHLSEEHKEKLSKAQRGEKSWKWKGGTIPYYGSDWNRQRKLALKRSNYTCICGNRESVVRGGVRTLDVHHIVSYRISKDNSQNNLWTLCLLCHKRIEVTIETV